MRASIAGALLLASLGSAQDYPDEWLIEDFIQNLNEYVNMEVKLKSGETKAKLTIDRTPKAGEQDILFTKVHFSKFLIPVGCTLTLAGENGETYVHSPTDREQRTMNSLEGEDGETKFASMSIDGHKVDATLECEDADVTGKGLWNDDMHGVTIGKITKAVAYPSLRATKQRDADPLTICGQNERLDAACHKQNYPTEFKYSYNVARLVISTPGGSSGVCTTWRVSPDNLMMTNNHCFKEQHELTNSEVHFNYQKTRCGGSYADAGTVKVRPDRLLRTSGPLDYTIYTLTASGFNTIRNWRGSGGETIGYFVLEVREPVEEQDKIYIPQHGAGDPKQISITDDQDAGRECKIKNVKWSNDDRLIGYSCDTVGGTSGSPVVLRGTNKVIGLHNKGGCSGEGKAIDPRYAKYYTNGGIKINRIWPEIRGFFSGGDSVPAPTPAPRPTNVDCQGYWGECDAECKLTFYVTTAAVGNGECPPSDASLNRPVCRDGVGKCSTAPACTPNCLGKSCGGDGCGGSCGTCSASAYCTSAATCRTRSPPTPTPNPSDSVPSCARKTCNYIISDDFNCPSGYTSITSPVAGCQSVEDECAHAFAEAIRARTTNRAYVPAKKVWGSLRTGPSACHTVTFSGGEEYIFYRHGAAVTPSSYHKAVCRKNDHYGPGCGGTCYPRCTGKVCGDDGCGGSCGPGCNVAAGESCNSITGQCSAPTCGKASSSLCNRVGYMPGTNPDRQCTRNRDGTYCQVSECCKQQTCGANAQCSSTMTMAASTSTHCSDCVGGGTFKSQDPKSCCFPKTTVPVTTSCPADTFSASLCSTVVSYSRSYPTQLCNDPNGRYTVGCKTSCKNAGYKVCGEELASLVSLAASQGGSGGGGGGGVSGAALAGIICAGLFTGLLVGFFVTKHRSSQSQDSLGQTTGSMSPTRRLDDIEHKKLAGDADI